MNIVPRVRKISRGPKTKSGAAVQYLVGARDLRTF
jgi:hypothetical protein